MRSVDKIITSTTEEWNFKPETQAINHDVVQSERERESVRESRARRK